MEWGDKMAVLAKPTYQPGAPRRAFCLLGSRLRRGRRTDSLLASGLRGRPDVFVKGTRLTA